MGLRGAEEYAVRLTEGPWAGWLEWTEVEDGTFVQVLGPSRSLARSANHATVILETRSLHGNRMAMLHGGFVAAFADHAYFATLFALGRPDQVHGVTVDLSMQYCGGSRTGSALRAEVELLRETGRLFFMRMTLHQDDDLVASSTATIRKALKAK